MTRSLSVAVLLGCVACGPCLAQSTAPYDEIRREVAALAERVSRLEAENAALRRQNEQLAQIVGAESRPPPVVPSAPPAPVPAPGESAPLPWYENFKVSGYLIGDAYGVISNHDAAVEDQTGFWIRRAYLTFDTRVADEWSARLRFEANSPGDFTTNSKLEPFVKDAYLAWKRGGRELHFGLASSPTFEFVEGFWSFRSVEKTPLDLYRIGSSRDIGVAFKGKGAEGRVFYHAMFGNGAGDGAETNEGKKVMGSLGFKPTDALVAEVYADFEDRPGSTDRTTWQAFVGWADSRSRYGLQYASQDREIESGSEDTVAVASAFGAWRLTDQGTLVARYDRSFDGYADADRIPYLRIVNDTPFDLAILAWEHKLASQISVIPNLEYVRYRSRDGLPAPDDDLYGRLTLYYQF